MRDVVAAMEGAETACGACETGPGVPRELGAALAARGLSVGTWLASAPARPAGGLLVLGGGHEGLDADLGRAEAHRAHGGDAAVVLLTDGLSESQARWAGRLTPYQYPAYLSAEALATFALRAFREGRARAALPLLRPRRERHVCLNVGEVSVEIDGRPVLLGVAERNFLMLLAARDGFVGKEARIDCEPGRTVVANECRRRLGRRLGPELASLLVPEGRNEPYRLRSPQEVEAVAAESPHAHPPTRLRIIGRCSVRTVALPRLDGFDGRPMRSPRRERTE